MTTIFYRGGNPQETARRHFRNAEIEMLKHFPGLKPNYDYRFDGWDLSIWNLETPEEIHKVNMEKCCQWQFQEEYGISYKEGDRKKTLLFQESLFPINKEKRIEFTGILVW